MDPSTVKEEDIDMFRTGVYQLNLAARAKDPLDAMSSMFADTEKSKSPDPAKVILAV